MIYKSIFLYCLMLSVNGIPIGKASPGGPITMSKLNAPQTNPTRPNAASAPVVVAKKLASAPKPTPQAAAKPIPKAEIKKESPERSYMLSLRDKQIVIWGNGLNADSGFLCWLRWVDRYTIGISTESNGSIQIIWKSSLFSLAPIGA
jgi:hypothetical protein